MKTRSILRPAAWASAITLVLGIQTALAEPLVYVPLGSKDGIAVVDAANDKVVGAIGGVTRVHGLAGTPDGRFLIAGSVKERAAASAAPEKPSGMSAGAHAAHHSAASADAKSGDAVVSTLSIIRTADNTVVRRIDVPGAVHHVAVSPNGRFAVVTHPNLGKVSAIDLRTYEVVASVSTGPVPNYAVFSSDNGRVYVSNAGNNTVSEVDTGQWVVRGAMLTGSGPEHMVASQDGQRLYVANTDDGTVNEITISSSETLRTFNIGDLLHGIDLSSDGTTLFVSARGQDKLVAVDLPTGKTREAALNPAPYHLATIGGTGKLYVSSAGRPDIWVVDQNSLAVLGTIPIGGKGHQMVLSAGS